MKAFTASMQTPLRQDLWMHMRETARTDQLGKFPIGRGNVLKEEPLSLAVDFVAVQIVLVCPVSVVRDYSQCSP